MKKNFEVIWSKIILPVSWPARKITRWHIAVRRLAACILFCALGLGAALGGWLWPVFFSDAEMYNMAWANLQHESSWQKAFDTLTFLRGSSRDQNIRQASAYTMGTFLAESNNSQILTIAEGMLEDAVWLDPHDERAQTNLEIVRRKIRTFSSDSELSELDRKMKENDAKPSVKQPREPKPGDIKYGRGGSGGESY